MSREILFRGKRIHSGEWVEGLLITNKLGFFIIDEKNPHYCDQYGYIEIDTPKKVIPETVGQFTGLSDKNGTKIFKGDILESGIDKKMLVIWRKDLASFALTANGWMYDHYFGEGADAGRCNIIGNIHDNPELIGKEAQHG